MKKRHLIAIIRGFVDGIALCVIVLVCLWVYHL
jgi:hypothetical protein